MSKPAFDPNQPYEEIKPKFDPTKPFSSEHKDSSFGDKAETALRSYGNAMTLGYGDNIRAATEPATFAVLNALTGNDVESDPDYVNRRDEEIKQTKQMQKENPISSKIGTVAGALNSIVLPSANIGKGAAIGSRLLNSAITGGGMGLLQNPGEKEGEVSDFQISDRLKSGAIGTGIGLGLQGGGEMFANAMKSSPTFQRLANRMSARAMGAERGTIKKIGEEKVQEIGQYGLDNKLFGHLSNTDDMIAANAAKQAEGGKMMESVYNKIDAAGKSTFNPQKTMYKVEEELGGFYRSPINKGETSQLENTLDSIMMRGTENIPLKEAQALKQELGKVANWKSNVVVTDKEKMAREAYGIVSGHIDDAVEQGAREIGTKGLKETLEQGKKLFSNSKGAEQLLENKLAREQGNNLMGFSDKVILGASVPGAVMSGGASVLPTMAGMVAKRGLEKYGAQNMALGANAISKGLQKIPDAVVNATQKAPKFMVNSYQNAARDPFLKPEDQRNNIPIPRNAEDQTQKPGAHVDKDTIINKLQGTKYQQVLQNAANNGEGSFSAAHYILSQRDPIYRKHLETEE